MAQFAVPGGISEEEFLVELGGGIGGGAVFGGGRGGVEGEGEFDG